MMMVAVDPFHSQYLLAMHGYGGEKDEALDPHIILSFVYVFIRGAGDPV